jgi:uncharacterized protein YegL
MKHDYTDITIVLDRSGSMASVKDDTIGGFNQFVADQKQVPGTGKITLVQFDDQYESVYRSVPLASAPSLTPATFVPRGSTALLDAIGRTIDETGARFSATAEPDRPGKVVFVILTDGMENASRTFTLAKINEMIALQRDVYKWQFIFLGANQDAIATAAAMQIPAAQALTYAATGKGMKQAFAAFTGHMQKWRAGEESELCFSEGDREEQEELIKEKEGKNPGGKKKPGKK